ncbi:MAG: aldo/keto reductase [Candidatus Rokubacteria bacterium]|nr:aldo/keto reductase [Candidatus Rokubacteria bacterium]
MTGLLAGPDPVTSERLAAHPEALGAREWWLWTRQRGVPLQAVALQFPMRHPGVGTVVIGANNPLEVEESVAAATFPVPAEIWTEVEERMRRRA